MTQPTKAEMAARVTPRTEVALFSVLLERGRQEQRKAEGRFLFTCADDGLSLAEKFTILGEEVGEVAREALTNSRRRLARDTEGTDEALYKELAQVAAVAVAWMESLLEEGSCERPAAEATSHA